MYHPPHDMLLQKRRGIILRPSYYCLQQVGNKTPQRKSWKHRLGHGGAKEKKRKNKKEAVKWGEGKPQP